MEKNLEVFNHVEFGDVRVIGDSENPRFCLADVCKVLGLDSSQVMKRLDDGVVSIHPTPDALGRIRDTNFVSEDGLYDVILDSRKPAAKKFRKWLTSEVIPSIRKTGLYINPNAPIDPKFLRRMADELEAKNKIIAEQEHVIAELQPKADYCESILQSSEGLPITIIAKDYGQSAVAFNQLLAKYKIQHRVGNAWVINEPYSKMGYTKSETFKLPNGFVTTRTTWTQKGRMFLYNILKKFSLLPVCEREEPMTALL